MIIVTPQGAKPWRIEDGQPPMEYILKTLYIVLPGGEYQRIHEMFSNLPQDVCKENVCYFGDHAKFILANL